MKTIFKNKIMALVMTLVLTSSFFYATVSVQAAEIKSDENVTVTDATAMSATPASTNAHVSYYPQYGHPSSGYFSGKRSNAAVYTSLPAGIMKVAYSMSGGTTCYIEFYHSSDLNSPAATTNALNANYGDGIVSVVLPFSGKYYVKVYYPNGNQNTEIIYAFNLFTE